MKNISIILAALAAVVAISCNKENPVETPDNSISAGMKLVTVTASVDQSTKTSYTDNGEGEGVFSWTKGDQISIRCIDTENNRKYFTFTAETTSSTTTFKAYIPDNFTPETEAFFPASDGHDWISWQPYFHIPEYRDMKKHESADIPMFGKITDGVYEFTHMCGAARLEFTNFPTDVTTAEISIVHSALKLSGTFKVSYSGENSEYMKWNSAEASNDSEKTYTRVVPVSEGKAIIYLPYHGELWGNSTVSVIGYDNAGNKFVLLEGLTMKGNSTRFERGVVQPYAPYALPDYVPEVNWNMIEWTSETAVSPTVEGFTDVKVVADKYYLYARIEAPVTLAWDQLYYYMGSGEGSTALTWAWTTVAAKTYDDDGPASIEALTLKYNGVTVDTKVETVGENAYWYMAFPRNAHEITKESGDIYFALMGYVDGGFAGASPKRWGPSMIVTLP